MNKKILLGIGLLSGIAVTGAGMLARAPKLTAMAAQITRESAEDIALSHAGISSDDIAYIVTETDYERGSLVYEVEFITKDYREYDYEIRAEDGSIISNDYDAEAAFYRSVSAKAGTADITVEKAKEIALANAGLKAEDVSFVKQQPDYDDGIQVYDIEFVTSDMNEYDYEISAVTGEIISMDHDAEYYYAGRAAERKRAREGSVNTGAGNADEALVSIDEAKRTVLEKAGFFDDELDFINIRPDYDDGRMQYEGKLVKDGFEYEFEVDRLTGRITDWEIESIYD